MNEVLYERGGPGDIDAVRLALYLAVSWTGNPKIPPFEQAIQHPDIARYHEGWGRPGDLAVKALMGGEVAGAAFARLFTDDDHGHGYVDDETPELGIGIVADHRGRGIGRRLMVELAELARSEGVNRLSLSVNHGNHAKALYASLGYSVVSEDDNSSIMISKL